MKEQNQQTLQQQNQNEEQYKCINPQSEQGISQDNNEVQYANINPQPQSQNEMHNVNNQMQQIAINSDHIERQNSASMQSVQSASIDNSKANNIGEYLSILAAIRDSIQQTPQEILPDLKNSVQEIQQLSQQFSVLDKVNLLTQVGNTLKAINERLPNNSQQVVQQQQANLYAQQEIQPMLEPTVNTKVIPFNGLYSFQQVMSSRRTDFELNRLKGLAQEQYKHYNSKGIIDYHAQRPNMPLQQLFVSTPRTKNTLTEDQIKHFLKITTPTEQTINKELCRVPTLNPDFQFNSTQMGLNLKQLAKFSDFDVQAHVDSAMADHHKEVQQGKPQLNIIQLFARFAYRRGCRYFAIRFPKEQNVQYDEIIGFFHCNNHLPMDHDGLKPAVRATIPRDGHTFASMGEGCLFHADNERMFIEGFFNLNRNIPPILTVGASADIYIVSPDANLKEPIDLPGPKRYEALLPQICSWATTSIYYMAERFEKAATPCLWLGGLFMPCMQMRNCGMLGQSIMRMPKFSNNRQIDELKLYYWNQQDSNWVESSTPYEERYIISHLESLNNKRDIYGTWYHHTICRHDVSTTRVKLSPLIKYGDSRTVIKPKDFTYQHDDFINKVILGRYYQQAAEVRQNMFEQYISERCQFQLEWSLRYAQYEPYKPFQSTINIELKTHEEQGSIYRAQLYPKQSPGIYDLLLDCAQRPATRNYYVEAQDWSSFGFIPKSIALHYDDQADAYSKSMAMRQQVPQKHNNGGFYQVTGKKYKRNQNQYQYYK